MDALTRTRGTKREARKEGAQLHGQLSVSEVEGEAARAEVVQAPAQQAHQAERAAQEVERLQRRLGELEKAREGAVRERDEECVCKAVVQAELAGEVSSVMAGLHEEGRWEAVASEAASEAAASAAATVECVAAAAA